MNRKKEIPEDDEGYVLFGDIARDRLNKQNQYASRYVEGTMEGYPNLGRGLKFKGSPDEYHSLKIHKDSVPIFVERYFSYIGNLPFYFQSEKMERKE